MCGIVKDFFMATHEKGQHTALFSRKQSHTDLNLRNQQHKECNLTTSWPFSFLSSFPASQELRQLGTPLETPLLCWLVSSSPSLESVLSLDGGLGEERIENILFHGSRCRSIMSKWSFYADLLEWKCGRWSTIIREIFMLTTNCGPSTVSICLFLNMLLCSTWLLVFITMFLIYLFFDPLKTNKKNPICTFNLNSTSLSFCAAFAKALDWSTQCFQDSVGQDVYGHLVVFHHEVPLHLFIKWYSLFHPFSGAFIVFGPAWLPCKPVLDSAPKQTLFHLGCRWMRHFSQT